MITIVLERREDLSSVRNLTVDAFSNSEYGHNGEADLVDELRNACDDALSLVAIENEHVVGHVLFSPVVVRVGERAVGGMGLAPVSVSPSRQNRGVGSSLITTGLEKLAAQGALFTIVAGEGNYYRRFGFQPAADFELVHGFAGMPQSMLFIQTEHPDSVRNLRGGLVYYHAAFGPQHL